MILSCIDIKKTFGVEEILSNVTFSIAKGEKAAIVGVNGAGKTTVFKIITGEQLKDSGNIIMPTGTKLGYMSQMPPLILTNTIYDELLTVFDDLINLEKEIEVLGVQLGALSGDDLETAMKRYDRLSEEFKNQDGYMYKSKVRGVIRGLGFAEENTVVDSLSGGQKTKLSMAKLLLSSPDILLLDEPTNHLDLESVAWLEDFLKNYRGTVLIISHDRYFINKIVTKVIEIENRKSTVYHGNYDYFLVKKEEEKIIAQSHYDNQQKIIKEQEDSIRRLKSYDSIKSMKRAFSKEKQLEKMEKIDAPESEPHKIRLDLTPKITSGNDVLTVKNISKSFEDKKIFEGINFEIKRGEKTALIGPVGVGKTTMLKILLDALTSDSGDVKLGTNVSISYYEQEQESLDPNSTIFEEIHNAYPNMTNIEIRSALAAFVFYGDDVTKKISGLSGGERARVYLCKIMLAGANFLVLDEPTNHLDISTKNILEEALNEYTGTLLYISHDRYFINRTANRILELNKNGMNIYLGNYDYYLEKKQLDTKNIETVSQEKTSENKENYKAKKEQAKDQRKLENQIKKLERQIEETEEKITGLDELLANETDHVELARIFKEKEDASKFLEELLEQWEGLAQ